MAVDKRLIAAVLGVLLFVAAVAIAVIAFSGDDASYTLETRESFIEACSADGGADVESVCVCWYDSITQSIPYERYDEVNTEFLDQLAADPDTLIVAPDDFEVLLDDCRPT